MLGLPLNASGIEEDVNESAPLIALFTAIAVPLRTGWILYRCGLSRKAGPREVLFESLAALGYVFRIASQLRLTNDALMA